MSALYKPKFLFRAVLIALSLCLGHATVSAGEPQATPCTDRAECWPEGSSMHTGLLLVQRQKSAEKTLELSHNELLKLVSSSRSTDGTYGTEMRLLQALKSQHTAWLKYRSEECELVGSLTGAGGTWPSTYANQCEVNHTEQRIRRVRSAMRCIEKLPGSQRLFEQNTCLQQLAPLTNK